MYFTVQLLKIVIYENIALLLLTLCSRVEFTLTFNFTLVNCVTFYSLMYTLYKYITVDVCGCVS